VRDDPHVLSAADARALVARQRVQLHDLVLDGQAYAADRLEALARGEVVELRAFAPDGAAEQVRVRAEASVAPDDALLEAFAEGFRAGERDGNPMFGTGDDEIRAEFDAWRTGDPVRPRCGIRSPANGLLGCDRDQGHDGPHSWDRAT
jgi:hypothetical protein